MRRHRPLTSSERWELGLFLTMLGTGFLCLTAITKLHGIPKLFAIGDDPAVTQAPEMLIDSAPATTPLAAAAAPVTMTVPQFTAPAPVPAPAAPAPVQPKAAPKKAAVEYKYFNGQKYKFVKTLRMRVTAYSPDAKCCWPYDGTTTASGLSVKTNRGHLVAADTRIVPMYALVSIPGYHDATPVPVLDRGGAIKGQRLDVLLPTFDQAKNWGSRLLEVKIYAPVN